MGKPHVLGSEALAWSLEPWSERDVAEDERRGGHAGESRSLRELKQRYDRRTCG